MVLRCWSLGEVKGAGWKKALQPLYCILFEQTIVVLQLAPPSVWCRNSAICSPYVFEFAYQMYSYSLMSCQE